MTATEYRQSPRSSQSPEASQGAPASAFDAALLYVRRGWAPIPLSYMKKDVVTKEWQNLRITEATLSRYFNGHPQNIGVLLGEPSGGLLDVDLDAPEAVELAPYLLPATSCVFGRRGKPCSHWLYKAVSLPVDTAKFQDPEGKMLVELRSTGCQTVFPHSVHPSGEAIEWVLAEEPAPIEGKELRERVARLAAAALLARHWPQSGSRQEAALALSGGLLRTGWSVEAAGHFVRAVAIAAGDEETAKRAAASEYTAKRLNQDRAATGWPTLAALVGERVVERVRDWLGIGSAQAGDSYSFASTRRAESAESAESQTPEPEPPGAAAFEGLAGEVVGLIDPFTEADRVGVLVNFLAAFGCAVGRGPHMMVGATQHDPRIFMALVGRSSKARKGESWTPVRELFRLVDEEWITSRLLSGLSTGEGLIYAVRDSVEKTEKSKEAKGEYEVVMVDAGEPDKRLLVMEPELARVLQVMSRQGNTLNSVIRDAWDRGDLHTMTKGSPAHATGAYISIMGHITVDELRRELSDTNAANGFANRFIWLSVRRSKFLPNPEPFGGPQVEQMAQRIAGVVAWAKQIERMERDAEANDLWVHIYPELSAERDGLVAAVLARAEAQVTRLSLLYALLDRSPVVRATHLLSAVELWAYSERSAEYIFGNATGDPVADTIYQALRACGKLTRMEVTGLFSRHVASARISLALSALFEQKKVTVRYEETGGRRQELWEFVG